MGRSDSYVTGRSGLERGVALALVVEEGALAREPRRLHERAVDALVAEGAHPRAVRRRVAERDRERRLLVDPANLVGQAPPDSLAQCGGDQTVLPESLRIFGTSQRGPRPAGALDPGGVAPRSSAS